MVVPAAAAERVTYRPMLAIVLAIVISLASTLGGLVLAFVGHWPASFYIVGLTSLFYVAALGIHALGFPHYRREPCPIRAAKCFLRIKACQAGIM